MSSVTGIIVTFNRKKELIRCIKALISQSTKLDNLLIIDNHSNDGTLEELGVFFKSNLVQLPKDKLNFLCSFSKVNIYIYSSSVNGGGSKGFHIGMKQAFENLNTDLYWMMDDDGYPDKNCLEMLKKKVKNYDYIMPASIDINNDNKLSWPVRMRNGKKTLNYKELRNSWGKLMDFVTPFNGVLLSRRCLRDVGYVDERFFLWGDEYDHYWRCKEKGIQPKTLLDAKFYHPSQKLPLVKIFGGLLTVPYVDSKLRMVCLARNYTYIYNKYGQRYKIPLKFLQYTWLFLITRHLDINGWLLYIKSVNDGLHNKFSRHKKFLGD